MRKHKRATASTVDARPALPPQSHHSDLPGRHAPEQLVVITRNTRPASAEYTVRGSHTLFMAPPSPNDGQLYRTAGIR